MSEVFNNNFFTVENKNTLRELSGLLKGGNIIIVFVSNASLTQRYSQLIKMKNALGTRFLYIWELLFLTKLIFQILEDNMRPVIFTDTGSLMKITFFTLTKENSEIFLYYYLCY